MKRITLFSVAAVLLFTGTASASLMVYEYVPDEKVTLDSATGKYWYWNLSDFVMMTYAQQITEIGDISPTYGNIAGGWHMASLAEMVTIWPYGVDVITTVFGSANVSGWDYNSLGRFERPAPEPLTHYIAGRLSSGAWTTLYNQGAYDSDWFTDIGAWVVTDATVVPLPPSVVMVTTGFLSLMGAKLWGRWRHRQGPSSQVFDYRVTVGAQATDGPSLPTSNVVPNALD